MSIAQASSIITLSTDFGTTDWFVGVMKGVILGINPKVTLVDLTHGINSGDIRAGAFALRAAYAYFPRGTIHVVVVDPGVGSERRALAVRTERYGFVGPDNGVLSFALANEKVQTVHRLENPRYFIQPVSRTFHGRDIFAAVAGHLSKGVPIKRLGPATTDYVRLEWPQPKITKVGIIGQIAYIDRFGNGITNIEEKILAAHQVINLRSIKQSLLTSAATIRTRSECKVYFRRRSLGPIRSFYQEAPIGGCVALVGSGGLLEIAVNQGSAAKALELKIGDRIEVKFGRLPRASGVPWVA